MASRMRAGVIGCGNISHAYMRLAPLFRGVRIVACADLDMKAAASRAEEFGLRAETVDGLLSASDIDIVVNLTVPAAHHAVSRMALEAGKHVYSEKPFALTLKEGLDLKARALAKGLRIGSAPDTFLGGAHQLARHIIDSGQLGRITSGTCHVMNHGMEHWHPNPAFFYKSGGGPVLDLGPYYITNLVQLIGPVRRVAALATIPSGERRITSQPRGGQIIKVETPTTVHALLEFASGAIVTLSASWDVWAHGHAPMELYGEGGCLFLPEPNFFGGEVRHTLRTDFPKEKPRWDHPFARANQDSPRGRLANYRGAGLADMAVAILEDRPHRCSLDMALHVTDVMTGILASAADGCFVDTTTRCERPDALDVAAARDLIARQPAGRARRAVVSC
jgi:predicted dehydrogenase